MLFDQGTPVPLRRALAGHSVETAHERGWSRFRNGDLLAIAEATGFDVLVTTDRNLRYQLNLDQRRIAIVVLPTTSWPRLQSIAPEILEAVSAASPGSYRQVTTFGAA